jgi:hypothetical protein
MPLISLIIACCLIVFVLYIIRVNVAHTALRNGLTLFVVIVAVVFLLNAFGLLPALNDIRLR